MMPHHPEMSTTDALLAGCAPVIVLLICVVGFLILSSPK